jgi:hypothetical protein
MSKWMKREVFENSYLSAHCWIAYGQGKVYQAYYDQGVYRLEKGGEAEFYRGKIKAVIPFEMPTFPEGEIE